MCKAGDIIIINKFKNEFNQDVTRHPFIILEESGGEIFGMPFDFIALLLSSFKNKEHREKKLSYLENIEINKDEGVLKDSFAKGDQFYYFAKSNIDYFVVGQVNDSALKRIQERLEVIIENDLAVVVTDNLEL